MSGSRSGLRSIAILGTGALLSLAIGSGAQAQRFGSYYGRAVPTGIIGSYLPGSGWIAPGVFQFSPGPGAFSYRVNASRFGQYAPIPTFVGVGYYGSIQTGVHGSRYEPFLAPYPYPGYVLPGSGYGAPIGSGYGTPAGPGSGYGTPELPRTGEPAAPRTDQRPAARITLSITPGDAMVYIDGAGIGRADQFAEAGAEVRLPAGEYLVEAFKPGYAPYSREVALKAGERQRIEAALEKSDQPAPDLGPGRSGERPRGRLKLTVSPADAQVYLDGRLIGTGKTLTERGTFDWVPAGRHTLEVRRSGYRGVTEEITVSPLRPLDLQIILGRQ